MKSTAFLLIGLLIGISVMIFINNNQPSPIETIDPRRELTPTAVVLTSKTVLTQLVGVTKLVTTEATIDTVVDLENNTQYITWRSGFKPLDYVLNVFDKKLGQRYMKIQGRGTFKAGVDLSKLDYTNDITISADGKTVEVHLPDSEPLGTAEVDFKHTYPLALEQGILISKNDFTITEQGYDKVGSKLNSRLCDSAILEVAARRAEETVKALIHAFNPTVTTVNVFSAAGSCSQ